MQIQILLWMMCQVSKAQRKITGLLTIHNTCIVLLKPKFMILKDRRLSVKIKKKKLFDLIVPSILFLLSLLKSYYKV